MPTVSPGREPTARTAASTPGMKDDPIERVVPDGQGLALGAEQHLLVGDQPAQPDAVHPDPVDVGAAGARQLLHGGVGGRRQLGRRSGGRDPARGGGRRPGRGVGLVRVVQLDDLHALVEARPPARRSASSAPPRWRSSPPRRCRPRGPRSWPRSWSSRSSVKPVVPTTAWMPCSMHHVRLSITASGWVKSTTTSAASTGVRSSPTSSAATSSSPSAASTARHTSAPIRPRPRRHPP